MKVEWDDNLKGHRVTFVDSKNKRMTALHIVYKYPYIYFSHFFQEYDPELNEFTSKTHDSYLLLNLKLDFTKKILENLGVYYSVDEDGILAIYDLKNDMYWGGGPVDSLEAECRMFAKEENFKISTDVDIVKVIVRSTVEAKRFHLEHIGPLVDTTFAPILKKNIISNLKEENENDIQGN